MRYEQKVTNNEQKVTNNEQNITNNGDSFEQETRVNISLKKQYQLLYINKTK